jgi:hypothetical protein
MVKGGSASNPPLEALSSLLLYKGGTEFVWAKDISARMGTAYD